MVWILGGKCDIGQVISAGGHGFDPLTKPSKSYMNRRDVNWSSQVE